MAAAVIIAGCTRLPSQFESLSPDDKVSAYLTYLRDGGPPQIRARRLIANDGMPAADAIARVLNGMSDDTDKEELILILQDIQTGGADLRGTRAESALRNIAALRTSNRDLTELAEATLDIINKHIVEATPAVRTNR